MYIPQGRATGLLNNTRESTVGAQKRKKNPELSSLI